MATSDNILEHLIAVVSLPMRYLAEGQVAAITLCVAAGFLSPGAAPVVLAVSILLLSAGWLIQGHLAPGTRADRLIALLVVMLPITLWASPSGAATRIQVARLLLCLTLFYAIAGAATPMDRWRRLTLGIVLLGLLLAATAPFTVQWKQPALRQTFSAHALRGLTGIDHDAMAAALVLLLPLAVAIAIAPRKPGRAGNSVSVVSGAAAVFIGVVIILTESVGALGAAIAGLAVLVALERPRLFGVLSLTTVVGLAVAALASGGAGPAQSVRNEISGDLMGRVVTWLSAYHLLQDFPLTGAGLGTFPQAAKAFYPPMLAGSGVAVTQAYNGWLQAGAELGVPGLIVWVLLPLTALAEAWHLRGLARASGQVSLATLAAGLVGSQVALIVHGFVDASTWAMWPSAIVWALWALIAAGRQQTRQLSTEN